jgi:3-isopropylmalate dehydrogenase
MKFMHKKITILPGDGIGKEVTAEGKKVLEKVAELFEHSRLSLMKH